MRSTRSPQWTSKVRGWHRASRTVLACAACLAVSLPLSLTAQLAAVTSASADLAPATSVPQIIPKPVSTTVGQGTFTLATSTSIVVPSGSDAALPVAQDLADYMRPATGYALPVVTGTPSSGDIELILGDPGGLQNDPDGEGYHLDTTTSGVTLEAPTPHGLYNGVQTIRQLLPAWITSSSVQPGPWTMPVVQISDYPRYTYRGLMLDIARHYEPPSAVEQLIDQAAAYKINTLHLHVSDDQGFRIVINGFPNLTTIGGQGSVGTGGRTMDPGGYWTQSDYQAVVAYAAAHFMTVVPEVDSPGHNNAIIMSEYNDTANPLLDGNPQDINCGANNPPMWDYTEDVGYSAMCPESTNTWAIMSAIIDQLAAMSPGPYYDIGGDEVPTTLLSQSRYASFVNQEAGIVQGQSKTVMGWADIAGPGTNLTGPSVAEYWNPASGSTSGTITATEAVQKGMKVVMAPASHAYLDQRYRRNVPPTLGLTWACTKGCDVDQFYNWDPGSYVTGVTDANVIGVEGAMWGETVVNLSNVDYMVFPRLPALAEISWSPKADRTSVRSPAYRDFIGRLAAQGTRLMAGGVNFYPSTEVPWGLSLAASDMTASSQDQVSGTVATLAAPGYAPSAVTATINWGDGSSTPATVTGTAPTATTVNSLYTIAGAHTYATAGV
ncbi:MAG TPA: beta-N-acetylhexosaminidase, partial [Streptosporangiaceae bacterium]